MENNIELNKNEQIKNEIFPFLTFNTNLDSSLKFLADFLNKILKPKYQLMGKIFIIWLFMFINYNINIGYYDLSLLFKKNNFKI